jgi:hypothetical protein
MHAPRVQELVPQLLAMGRSKHPLRFVPRMDCGSPFLNQIRTEAGENEAAWPSISALMQRELLIMVLAYMVPAADTRG